MLPRLLVPPPEFSPPLSPLPFPSERVLPVSPFSGASSLYRIRCVLSHRGQTWQSSGMYRGPGASE